MPIQTIIVLQWFGIAAKEKCTLQTHTPHLYQPLYSCFEPLNASWQQVSQTYVLLHQSSFPPVIRCYLSLFCITMMSIQGLSRYLEYFIVVQPTFFMLVYAVTQLSAQVFLLLTISMLARSLCRVWFSLSSFTSLVSCTCRYTATPHT